MHELRELCDSILDNFSTVLFYAAGHPPAVRLFDAHLQGEWEALRKVIWIDAEVRADRALHQMASQMRLLDDAIDVNRRLLEDDFVETLGTVTQADGTVTDLYFRDMTNKVMHAAKFEWDLDDPAKPIVLCLPRRKERWQKAELDIGGLMIAVGRMLL